MSIARSLGKLLIPDLIKIYTTPTVIVNYLTGTPFSYNRQNMFKDVNTALNWQKYRDAKIATGPMTAGFHKTFDTYKDMRERYQIYGVSEWRDEVSGNLIRTESSFFTDYLSDDDDLIQNQFGDIWAEDEEKYKDRTFIGFVVEEVWKDPDKSDNKIHRIR